MHHTAVLGSVIPPGPIAAVLSVLIVAACMLLLWFLLIRPTYVDIRRAVARASARSQLKQFRARYPDHPIDSRREKAYIRYRQTPRTWRSRVRAPETVVDRQGRVHTLRHVRKLTDWLPLYAVAPRAYSGEKLKPTLAPAGFGWSSGGSSDGGGGFSGGGASGSF